MRSPIMKPFVKLFTYRLVFQGPTQGSEKHAVVLTKRRFFLHRVWERFQLSCEQRREHSLKHNTCQATTVQLQAPHQGDRQEKSSPSPHKLSPGGTHQACTKAGLNKTLISAKTHQEMEHQGGKAANRQLLVRKSSCR